MKSKTVYRCRFFSSSPSLGTWCDVEGDASEEAAMKFFWNNHYYLGGIYYSYIGDDGKPEEILFGLIEIEGDPEPYIARIFSRRIIRKGGVNVREKESPKDKLRRVAEKLGWEEDPSLLLEPGWQLEEEAWR